MTVVPQETSPQSNSDQPPAYEQQPGESAAHFAWFCAFLEMGPGRSVRGAYKIFYAKSPKVPKNPQVSPSWKEASHKWNWNGRAGVWDKVQREERLRKIRQREQNIIDRLFVRIESQLERGQQVDAFADFVLKYPRTQQQTIDGQTIINPGKWNFNTGIRAFQIAAEANKTAAELLELLGTLERNGVLREMASDDARQVMEARLTLEALGYKIAAPDEGELAPKSPTEMRAIENDRMAVLEAVLARQVEMGVPGAVDRLLKLSKRRAALYGLDKPFDPAAEEKRKKRKSLSDYNAAQLAILEEILGGDDDEGDD